MSTDFTGQNCGIYPRVSTKKQSKKDLTSLPDQIQACRDYAREQGMTVDEACVKPEAYTSTKMKRPELNALLANMKENRVPNLIIDRVDRMTRAGMLVAAQFLEQFTKAGITLHVVSMGEEEGDALIVSPRVDKSVKAFLDAAYDAQQMNKNRIRIVKRAKRSRAAKGIYLRGNRAPYGFRYVPVLSDERDEYGSPVILDKRHEPDT
jgi:DNA invertase Pin-like site-specific DNA recombinase